LLTSINRAQGANARKQTEWEKKQMRAAGTYAKALAAALRDDAARRSPLAKALAGVSATLPDGATLTLQDSLIRRGLPTSMIGALGKLGVGKAERTRITGWLLATDPLFLGGAPIPALADSRLVTALRKAAASLDAFARDVARDPLHTGG
jgi:hypothetical protein